MIEHVVMVRCDRWPSGCGCPNAAEISGGLLTVTSRGDNVLIDPRQLPDGWRLEWVPESGGVPCTTGGHYMLLCKSCAAERLKELRRLEHAREAPR